jgi:hypothetical protein
MIRLRALLVGLPTELLERSLAAAGALGLSTGVTRSPPMTANHPTAEMKAAHGNRDSRARQVVCGRAFAIPIRSQQRTIGRCGSAAARPDASTECTVTGSPSRGARADNAPAALHLLENRSFFYGAGNGRRGSDRDGGRRLQTGCHDGGQGEAGGECQGSNHVWLLG